MAASSYIQDQDFDALVDNLHDLVTGPQTTDRWEIRVLLARHGVLPLRVAAAPTMEDSLTDSLRALCDRASMSEARRRAA